MYITVQKTNISPFKQIYKHLNEQMCCIVTWSFCRCRQTVSEDFNWYSSLKQVFPPNRCRTAFTSIVQIILFANVGVYYSYKLSLMVRNIHFQFQEKTYLILIFHCVVVSVSFPCKYNTLLICKQNQTHCLTRGNSQAMY